MTATRSTTTKHDATRCDLPLKGKKIAVIGYGSQGHAHALNLHDSGCDVMVGLYKGSKSWANAEQAGLKVARIADAAARRDIVMMLVPDEKQRRSIEQDIEPDAEAGQDR